MGPHGTLKNDHGGRGSVHAKFQPVASHGDPIRANLEILKGWVNSEGGGKSVDPWSECFEPVGGRFTSPLPPSAGPWSVEV